MAVATCGRNMAPYCVLVRSYPAGSVKTVLAAGKVTRTMPWTSPARLTTRSSAVVAIAALRTAGQPSRESRWSPTRRALAIAVRAGFTAPMLGKKLVSTT